MKQANKKGEKMMKRVEGIQKDLKNDEWMIEDVKKDNKKLKEREDDLEKMQKDLEKIKDSWGEQVLQPDDGFVGDPVGPVGFDTNEVPMPVLSIHPLDAPGPGDFPSFFGGIADALRKRMEEIRKTGPASKVKAPASFLKPGAVKEEKKDEDKAKDEKKDEEKSDDDEKDRKARLRPQKIE